MDVKEGLCNQACGCRLSLLQPCAGVCCRCCLQSTLVVGLMTAKAKGEVSGVFGRCALLPPFLSLLPSHLQLLPSPNSCLSRPIIQRCVCSSLAPFVDHDSAAPCSAVFHTFPFITHTALPTGWATWVPLTPSMMWLYPQLWGLWTILWLIQPLMPSAVSSTCASELDLAPIFWQFHTCTM